MRPVNTIAVSELFKKRAIQVMLATRSAKSITNWTVEAQLDHIQRRAFEFIVTFYEDEPDRFTAGDDGPINSIHKMHF